MSASANFVWILFGGWFSWLVWVISGILACVTIIGIPFGKGCFTIASLALRPFGRVAIPAKDLKQESWMTGPLGLVLNILWIISGGLFLAVSEAALGIFLCFTIVGIPLGLQAFKLAYVSFAPIGKIIVPIEVSNELHRRNAISFLDKVGA
ncbi:MAG: Inner membrane protein YccF [bacterium ADurb.BinA186]|nr:MAG: Inner membrane protein YccF [bacterium ADurb.BinA186]